MEGREIFLFGPVFWKEREIEGNKIPLTQTWLPCNIGDLERDNTDLKYFKYID